MKDLFRKFAQKSSEIIGSPGSFIFAILLLLFWAISGPLFDFSDTWPEAINAIPTIITFLMVFLIQNTQNRDSIAIQLKLDELILEKHGARKSLVNLEELSEEEIEQLRKQFMRISKHFSKLTDTVEETEAAEVKDLAKEEHV